MKDAIFDAVQSVLGISQAAAEKMIQFSWPTDIGSRTASFPTTEEKCYIRIESIDNPGTGHIVQQFQNSGSGAVAITTAIQAAYQVTFILYGPSSMANAEMLYIGLCGEKALAILQGANMAPVPMGSLPRRFPENIDGKWYERWDMSITLYAMITVNDTQSAFATGPDVVIEKGE